MRFRFFCLVVALQILGACASEAQAVRTIAIHKLVRRPQEMSNWCWAACLQSLFLTTGVAVDQSDIVKAAYGEVANRRAPEMNDLVTLLNNLTVDIRGEQWKVRAYARPRYPNGRWLFDELKNGEAIMVWFRDPGQNHAIILDGGTYYVNRQGDFVRWRELRGYDPFYNKDMPIPAGSIPRFVYGTFYVKIEKAG